MPVSKYPLRSFIPARADRSLLPAALTAVLALAAVAQIALPSAAELPDAAVPTHHPRWTLPEVGEPVVPVAQLAAQGSLFTPTRIGAAGAAVAGGGTGATAPKPVPHGPLAGAFVLGAGRVGGHAWVLIRAPGGPALRLTPGASYRGWRLMRIDSDAAEFRQGGARRRFVYGSTPVTDDAGSDSENTSD